MLHAHGAFEAVPHGSPGMLKVVAVRDQFIVSSGRRCCQAVVSIRGYLATVVFLEATLARLETRLGSMCRLAESVGLLNDVKPETWETEICASGSQPWFLGHLILSCLRLLALAAAATLGRCHAAFLCGDNFQLDAGC